MKILASDWLKRLVFLLVIMPAAVVAMNQFTPPDVVPASAPPAEFSAERAFDHLKVIAKEPHPVGSPANTAVRDYLIQVITAMGLQPEVQTTTSVMRFPGAEGINTGKVQNVVVRLKGTANTQAILLDAHYDSADTGPGASDCGSCMVTLLETMRALKAGPPLKNDVNFVFADDEERGDLGVEAFASQHPWMKDVRVAINFEAQGSGGAALLYVTNPNNGWVVEQFLKVAPRPGGSSLWTTLFSGFKNLRPGCDLESYMERGRAGISFAYVGDTPAYHTMRDNVHVTDPRSIQQEGDYTLALVRHLGNLNLDQSTTAPDIVYFNVLPGVIIHYSQTWAVPWAVIVGLLFLAVIGIGFRRKQLIVGGLLQGTIVFAFSVFAALALTTLVWWAIKTLNSNYQVFMVGYYGGELNLLGLATFSVAVMAALYTWFRPRLRVSDLTAGALLVWAILMVLTSVVLPGVSYLFTWPLLFSLLALGWIFLAGNQELHTWQRVVVFSIAAVPGILLCIPAAYLLFLWMNRFEAQLNLPLAGVPTVFVALLMGLLIPHLHWLSGEAASGASSASSRRRWLVPGIIMLLSIVLLGVAVATSGFNSDHPRPDSINYVLDADSGKAVWISKDQHLDGWTSQFFPVGAHKSQVNLHPFSSVETFMAPAPSVSLAPPEVILLNDTTSSGKRTLDLRVSSPRRAMNAQVKVEVQGEIVEAVINSVLLPLDQEPNINRNRLEFIYSALPLEGIELTLILNSTNPVVVTVADLSQGLPSIPGMTITPRPPDTMPAPGNMVDPTIMTRSFKFARANWEENMPSEIKAITLHYLTDVNSYLVKTGDNHFLIDTGFSTKHNDFEKELESAGVRPGNLKLIVLTHGDFDHTGNAAYLRKKFGAEIAMNDGDSGMVERGDMFWNRKKGNILLGMMAPILFGFGKSERFKPDLYIEDGYNLSGYGFEAKVLHIPGHSKGSIGILTSGGDLFCGDLIMNEDKPGLNSNMDDSTAANASVGKLKNLSINKVYPGHGKPFPWEQFLRNYREKNREEN